MRQLKAIAAALAALILATSAHGDDAKQVNADEIRSKILGKMFRSESYEKEQQYTVRIYLSTDGKSLSQVDLEDKPLAIIVETYELKGDKLCLHDLGLMRKTSADRCYAAYMTTTESGRFWSGYMSDGQDPDTGFDLGTSFDVSAQEIEARWTKWESLRQQVGTIDAFAPMDEVTTNPLRFRGKVYAAVGDFHQMIADQTAWFFTANGLSLVVNGISNDLLKKEGEQALIIGEFTGTMRMTVGGNDIFVPTMSAKATRLCEEDRCKDFIEHY